MSTQSAKAATQQINRAAGLMMLPFLLSQVAGLVRQILATRIFGTGAAIDAYNGANILPNLIFNLLAGGALASAFVPTFTALLAKNERSAAWRLASGIINIALILLAILSLTAAIFAPQVTSLLVPNFSAEKQALTAQLLRILLLTSSVFGISGILSGILNAHQRFFLPALASSMYWLGLIIGLLFFVPSMGIFGLAWGAVLGAVLHLGIQLPDFFRLPEQQYQLTLGMDNPAVRQVVILMGPRLISVATVQLNFVVNAVIASGLVDGSLSAINYAFPIMTVPLVVIGSSLGFATLPTFSAQAARGEMTEMRQSLASALRMVLLLSIPATFGLILLREPLIAFLFQSGKFTQQSTQMVAWALLWYTAGLVGHSMLEVLARAFYALHNTKTPALIGAAAMLLNVVFSLLFSAWFGQIGWLPLGGLALANSLATALESATLLILLRRRLGGLNGGTIWRAAGAALAAAGGMSAALWGWLQWSANHAAWVQVAGAVILGGLAYALLLMLLHVAEVQAVLQWARRRFFRVG